MEDMVDMDDTASIDCAPQFGKDLKLEAQFTKFPELPTELRMQIWQEALQLQDGRLIKVRLPKDDQSPGEDSTDVEWAEWAEHIEHCPKQSPTPVPSLFLVCHESRDVAQRYIKYYCGAIPFNPHIDTLYLPEEVWNPRIKRAILKQIKHEHGLDDIRYLAADLVTWHGNISRMWRRLRNFKNLEGIFLVAPELNQCHEEKFNHFRTILQSLRAQEAFRFRRVGCYPRGRFPSPSKVKIKMVGLDWLNA
jgi:2EXR family